MRDLILVAAGCGLVAFYLAFVSVVVRPHLLVYAYVALWLVVPKALRMVYLTGGSFDFPEGITAFSALEATAAGGILVALMSRRRQSDGDRELRSFKRLSVALCCIALGTLVLSFGAARTFVTGDPDAVWRFIGDRVEPQYRWLPVLSILYATIFLFGFVRFIRTRRRVEPILWMFALSGVELALEQAAFVSLRLFGSLQRLAVEESGRFKSLVFTSYDLAGVFAIISIACSLTLALRGRRWAWPCFVLAWVPIVGGYQRAVLIGATVAAGVTIWRSLQRNARTLLASASVLLCVFVIATNAGDALTRSFGNALGGRVRQEYFSSEQFDVRYALWNRTLDVAAHIAPFGTGPGVTSEALNFPVPDADPLERSAVSSTIYRQVATGERTTNPHNMFLSFLLEYGWPGVAVMLAYALQLAALVRRTRPRDPQAGLEWGLGTRTAGLAILAGIGAHGLFESTPIPALVFVLPVVLMAFSRTDAETATDPDSVADRRPLVGARHA